MLAQLLFAGRPAGRRSFHSRIYRTFFLVIAVLSPKAFAYDRVIDTSTSPWKYADEGPTYEFPNGTWFSGAITDNAVLQKGDASAALYGGVCGGVSADAQVTLTVAEKGSANYTVTADILSMNEHAGNLTWKALLKPHVKQGGDIVITAQCTGCTNTTAATIVNVTFGDVWFCAGQSNMELGMGHALTRNRTYAAVDLRGLYANVRTYRHGRLKAMDGDEKFLTPPPVPAPAPKDGRAPTSYVGWQQPNSSKLHSFSAACWFFGQGLTDIAMDRNQTAPVLGLIESAWGGTEIGGWLRNRTIANCKNATGGALTPASTGLRTPGALWNGMVAPFVNYTIFGALWYQGENNVHACIGEGGGMAACGNVLNGTGYACETHNLVNSWRQQWSRVKGTTSPTFPFGIVSLAAGTSEGHSANMANFRHAQTASYGMLPGPVGSGMENTFIAQGYDAGDPGDRFEGPSRHFQHARNQWSEVDAPYQVLYDAPFPGRLGYSAAGMQRFTPQFMGGLHPRAKQTIGRRLALAAAHVAYRQEDVPFTGPVLKACTVLGQGVRCLPDNRDDPSCRSGPGKFSGIAQREILIDFDEASLGADAVHVWPTTPDTEGLVMMSMYNCLDGACLTKCNLGGADVACAQSCILRTPACQSGLAVTPIGPSRHGGQPQQHSNHYSWSGSSSVTPMEVQLNDTLWMPASISFDAGAGQGDPLQRNCQPDPHHPEKKPCQNWTRAEGWNTVVAVAPVAIPIGCGRGIDRETGAHLPCPPLAALRPGEWCANCTAHFRITGVRYAWSESPCCAGGLGDNVLPCPVNACPISTWNSTLPAVPFSAKIVYSNDSSLATGRCECAPPQICS